jgi:hypothetical protein
MFVIEANTVPGHQNAWLANRDRYWKTKRDSTMWDFYQEDNNFNFIFERREGYSGAVYEFKTEADYLLFVLKWS